MIGKIVINRPDPRFQRQNATFGPSTIVVDRPMVVINRPIALVDRPMVVVNRPIALVDRPMVVVDRPIAHVDRPMIVVDRPIALVARPMIVVDRPLIAAATVAPYAIRYSVSLLSKDQAAAAIRSQRRQGL